MLISTTYGNENFQHSSAKYQIFACRCRDHVAIEPAQKHLWMAAKNGDAGLARHGSINKVPAAPGYREEFGKWTTAQYDAPEGLVFKLFGQRKLPEMVSGRHVNASMLLHVRGEGPLVRVTGHLTGDERATAPSAVLFEGRADVIGLQDARDLGVIINQSFASQFESYNTDVLFTVDLLEDELSPRPVAEVTFIENTQGEEVRVVNPRRRRAIQV